LAQMTAICGAAVTLQAVAARFTPALAECFEQLLEVTVAQTIQTSPAVLELLNRFSGVYLLDSTVIALPDPLRTWWPGCGGSGRRAALKLQVRLDLRSGALQGPALLSGRTAEQRGPWAAQPLPAGSLWLADGGYFCLKQLASYSAQQVGWLMRLPCGTVVYDTHGRRLDVLRKLRRAGGWWDTEVLVGNEERLRCRLLVWPVAAPRVRKRRQAIRRNASKHGRAASRRRIQWCRYDVVITNLPSDRLSATEAPLLLRARWQIEMLFKLWKSYGKLDHSRSQQPWRRLAEIYAKLIGLVIQHWVLLVTHWDHPHRSWFRAIRLLQDHALLFAYEIDSCRQLAQSIRQIRACLSVCARTNIRNKSPSTYQLLTQPHQAGTLN
jgi:hypothetical protein